jgi:hypothetical protein
MSPCTLSAFSFCPLKNDICGALGNEADLEGAQGTSVAQKCQTALSHCGLIARPRFQDPVRAALLDSSVSLLLTNNKTDKNPNARSRTPTARACSPR